MPCPRKDEAAWRLAVVIRDGFSCVYCGTDLRSAEPKTVTLDHLIPKSHGGSSDPSNIVTACRPCNSSRKDRDWRDFAPGGAVARIEHLTDQPINLALASSFLKGEIR